jgi:hypothetical protein
LAGQSVLTNVLIYVLSTDATRVYISQIVITGAADLATVFPSNIISGTVRSYMTGLQAVYIIVIVSAGIATTLALLTPWRSLEGLRKKKAL